MIKHKNSRSKIYHIIIPLFLYNGISPHVFILIKKNVSKNGIELINTYQCGTTLQNDFFPKELTFL